MAFFLSQNVLIFDFLVQNRNQHLKIDPYSAKFQLDWTKDKGARILTWNNDIKQQVVQDFVAKKCKTEFVILSEWRVFIEAAWYTLF